MKPPVNTIKSRVKNWMSELTQYRMVNETILDRKGNSYSSRSNLIGNVYINELLVRRAPRTTFRSYALIGKNQNNQEVTIPITCCLIERTYKKLFSVDRRWFLTLKFPSAFLHDIELQPGETLEKAFTNTCFYNADQIKQYLPDPKVKIYNFKRLC